MADDIAFMPAVRLLALYRSKQLSPVEVIEHTLRRLETYESAINAFVLYDPETALAMARASEARWQKGEPQKRAPIFVGVSAADTHTAPDSRGLAGTLASLGWPYRVEERNAGHMVDWTFMAHGIAWLRARMPVPSTMAAR